MKQPKGLGRGLDAIFGTDAVDAKLKPMSQMSEIDITEITPNPTQPTPSCPNWRTPTM